MSRRQESKLVQARRIFEKAKADKNDLLVRYNAIADEGRQLAFRINNPENAADEFDARRRYRELEGVYHTVELQLNEAVLTERRAQIALRNLEYRQAEARRILNITPASLVNLNSEYTDADLRRYQELAKQVLQELKED